MSAGPRPAADGPRLTGLALSDPPELWSELGFAVADGRCVVGGVALHLRGRGAGILGWSFDRPTGLAVAPADVLAPPAPPEVVDRHPNGVTAVDHVVLAVDDLEAARRGLDASGIAIRRQWARSIGEVEVAYLFAVVGPTVLECVAGTGGPAGLWGITLVADDLDAACGHLGADPATVRDAVQPGRRIVALDTRPRGGSVRLAVMSPRHHRPDPRSEIS